MPRRPLSGALLGARHEARLCTNQLPRAAATLVQKEHSLSLRRWCTSVANAAGQPLSRKDQHMMMKRLYRQYLVCPVGSWSGSFGPRASSALQVVIASHVAFYIAKLQQLRKGLLNVCCRAWTVAFQCCVQQAVVGEAECSRCIPSFLSSVLQAPALLSTSYILQGCKGEHTASWNNCFILLSASTLL